MKLVADANILFSLARQSSSANDILSAYRLRLFSPDFVLSELKEHEEELQEKTNKSFEEAIASLKGKVSFKELTEYRSLLPKALAMLKDPEDAPYLALALKLAIPIWSNDPHLKQQSEIQAFTTKELIELLSSP